VNPIDVDSAVTRLFALLGVPVPTEGNITLHFHQGKVEKHHTTHVGTVRRNKPLAFAIDAVPSQNR
jgi:hypothetical protein